MNEGEPRPLQAVQALSASAVQCTVPGSEQAIPCDIQAEAAIGGVIGHACTDMMAYH